MKIVLHIGSSKAGSTTIQGSLEASHDLLARHGVLFPVSEKDGRRMNYRLLSNALCGVERSARSDRLLEKIGIQIEANRPETLFLSTEFIWGNYEYSNEIVSTLRRWSDDITFFGIVRECSSFYKSKLQQHLKGTGRLINPFSWRANVVKALDSWSAQPGANIEVLSFEPFSFLNGCLVQEVAKRFFPRVLGDEEKLSIASRNSSDPSEVTSIIQEYQLINYKDQPRMRRDDVVVLREQLLRISRTANIGTQPILRDNVRETILANHLEEIKSLQDGWGIRFTKLDDSLLETVKRDESIKVASRYGDVCDFSIEATRFLIKEAHNRGLLDSQNSVEIERNLCLISRPTARP